MNPKEREVVGLAVCLEALKSLVNKQLLHFTPVTQTPEEMEVRYPSSVHRDLFVIRLQDFLSETGSKDVLGYKASCLEVLQTVAAQPLFDRNGSSQALVAAVHELTAWINAPITPKFWLPTVGVEAVLIVSIKELLYISGNQAKHNPSRLSRVSKAVSELLKKHGHEVPAHQVAFVLNELQEHLGENLFLYYASWAAELLNAVWWGVQRYLEPLFQESYVQGDGDPPRYSYTNPEGVVALEAQGWFWELMNSIRTRPYVAPFKASRFLREKSSLEW